MCRILLMSQSLICRLLQEPWHHCERVLGVTETSYIKFVITTVVACKEVAMMNKQARNSQWHGLWGEERGE